LTIFRVNTNGTSSYSVVRHLLQLGARHFAKVVVKMNKSQHPSHMYIRSWPK